MLGTRDRWDPSAVYVVGHQRPDMDAIASAAGYAWYLRESGAVPEAQAARAGGIPDQADFALHRFNATAPPLLPGVAPTFGHAAVPAPAVGPLEPLYTAMQHLESGSRVVPVIYPSGRALGLVTSLALARAFARGQAARTCAEVAHEPPFLLEDDRISEHRNALLRREEDDYLVLERDLQYLGIATRGRILEPPRARLILVDHNELAQAVPGAEEAEIVAVLDHHRLGNPGTAAPIPFVVDPVGSTCTLVAERCRLANLEPPKGLCGLMLSGILSDTLMFRSPTTTPRDQNIARWLAERASVKIPEYGRELLSSGSGLTGEPIEVIDRDRKVYEMNGKRVSVAQVEVGNLEELGSKLDGLTDALEFERQRENLSLACVMVTDVIRGVSRLLCSGEPGMLRALPFNHIATGLYDLGGMVSRKKQLVPLLEELLKDLA